MAQHPTHTKGHPASGKTHAVTEQPAGHKGGLPQLNADDFAPQLVWLALTFGALYWIMSRVALPRIAEVLETRRGQIADDLDAARNFRQKSELAEAAYKSDLAEAKARARTIAQETRDRLNAKIDSKRAEVDAKINARLAESEKRIVSAKQKALKEINGIAASTTSGIVEKLTGENIPDENLTATIETIVTGQGRNA